jgi:hypothetical protein
MLIKAYCVESRRHGSVDFDPGPVLIGTVQFTANDRMEDQQREEEKAVTSSLAIALRLLGIQFADST